MPSFVAMLIGALMGWWLEWLAGCSGGGGGGDLRRRCDDVAAGGVSALQQTAADIHQEAVFIYRKVGKDTCKNRHKCLLVRKGTPSQGTYFSAQVCVRM